MSEPRQLLPGCWLLPLKRFDDLRGSFVKTWTSSGLQQLGISSEFSEEFYSVSKRDVIRGMHFQLPPRDHVKAVFCAVGGVLDVLLDLRSGGGYGKVASVELHAEEPRFLVIASGVAHGFRSLTDDSLMIYKTSTEHAPSHDTGLKWDSFGFDWGCAHPVMSDRDQRHAEFSTWKTPF